VRGILATLEQILMHHLVQQGVVVSESWPPQAGRLSVMARPSQLLRLCAHCPMRRPKGNVCETMSGIGLRTPSE
jgi:hypothetical protein